MADRILIIGAGIAGLSAARVLHQAGKDVLILDKGRRIGGRVSTRRADGFTFDHGAQFFTAHQRPLADLCEAGIASGMLKSWERPNGKTAIIGADMMRDLPHWLARLADGTELPIEQTAEVAQITQTDNGICLFDKTGASLGEAEQLIITAPAPQTKILLKEVAPELSQTAASASYDPCWTVMLGLSSDNPNPLPQIEAPDEDISFAADSRARRPQNGAMPALILQASARWSRAHLEETPDKVIDRLCTLYKAHLEKQASHYDMPEITYAAAHRWRYAKLAIAANTDLPRSSLSGRIHLAGDWLVAPRIEAAFMSGIDAAHAALDV